MFTQIIRVTREEFKYAVACSQYRLLNSRQCLQKVLVNGSPKTGTTWMLKMITSIPGYRVTAGYNFRGDINRYYEMLLGEVAHGHDPYTPQLWDILSSCDIKVILMLRDPRDQAVSRMFHAKRDITHGWHQQIKLLNVDDALMASIEGRPGLRGVTAAADLTRSWLAEGDKVICVKYEDLIINPVDELQRALQYLGIDVNPALARSIIERNRFERLATGRKIWKGTRKSGQEDASSHFRKGIVGDWKNYFKKAHIQRFKELTGDILVEWGYEKDINWSGLQND
jgi:hypothetical protein